MPKSAPRKSSEGSRRSRTRPTPAEAARRRPPRDWVERAQLGTGEGQPVVSVWSRLEDQAEV